MSMKNKDQIIDKILLVEAINKTLFDWLHTNDKEIMTAVSNGTHTPHVGDMSALAVEAVNQCRMIYKLADTV